MSEPMWLKRYFSKTDFEQLNPSVLFEGKRYAVVRVHRDGVAAFLGVWKGGRNDLTAAEPLLQGNAKPEQLKKFKDWLSKKEG